MIKICDENICTGCSACKEECPLQCITMQEDAFGEIHPEIDVLRCIACGKCVEICPNNRDAQLLSPQKVYAAYRKNQEKVLNSASGGVGAVFSETWVKEGGIVYGTAYDADFRPLVKGETTLEGIEAFKGSKYVQSCTDGVYRQIKDRLKNHQKVLFIGTPCQVAGLYSIVDRNNSNLLTVEILCHGVSPEVYFKQQLRYLEETGCVSEYDNVTFRTNQWMMDFYFAVWNHGKAVYDKQAYENEYFAAFLSGLSLRESCYACRYKKTARLGDIMIGDFIGFGKHVKYEGPKTRKSLVITTTDRGEAFLKSCSGELELIERTIEEAAIEGRSLREPFPRHPNQAEFREKYQKVGFVEAVQATLGEEMKVHRKQNTKNRFKRNLKFFLRRRFHIKIENKKFYYEKET